MYDSRNPAHVEARRWFDDVEDRYGPFPSPLHHVLKTSEISKISVAHLATVYAKLHQLSPAIRKVIPALLGKEPRCLADLITGNEVARMVFGHRANPRPVPLVSVATHVSDHERGRWSYYLPRDVLALFLDPDVKEKLAIPPRKVTVEDVLGYKKPRKVEPLTDWDLHQIVRIARRFKSGWTTTMTDVVRRVDPCDDRGRPVCASVFARRLRASLDLLRSAGVEVTLPRTRRGGKQYLFKYSPIS